MGIASCTTWECVNSFANWLSAVATILITGLALWLSVKDRMLLMKAELNVALIPSTNPNVLDTRVYALSFTNIGPRPITVTNHCWFLPFVKGVVFFMPHMDEQHGTLCSKLPLELTDGKEGHTFYSHDFFSKLDESGKYLFHRNRLVAWLRIHFFKICIATTVGKRLKVKVKWAVRRQLWKTYERADA